MSTFEKVQCKSIPIKLKGNTKNLKERRALLNLGNVVVKILKGNPISDDLIQPILNYVNISENVKNCQKGLETTNIMINMEINYEHSIFSEIEDDGLEMKNEIIDGLENYSKFMLIEADFENFILCFNTILKNVEEGLKKKLPSISKFRSIMDEFWIVGKSLVQKVSSM